MDLVLQDTPIYEKSLFSLIRSHFPLSDDTGKRQLQARIETVNHFIDYLEFQESKQPTQIIHAFGKVIDSIKGRLNPEIERIEKIVLGGKM